MSCILTIHFTRLYFHGKGGTVSGVGRVSCCSALVSCIFNEIVVCNIAMNCNVVGSYPGLSLARVTSYAAMVMSLPTCSISSTVGYQFLTQQVL